jgi:serine/threonine protein kinase
MGTPQAVGKQLQLERISGQGGSVVKLSGIIDDSFDRMQILEGTGGNTVFDLDGVTRITSSGVREWTNMLRGLPPDSYYCFVRAHPGMVSQFNMVSQFGVSGQIISFYAPFLCTSCDNYFEVLLDVRAHYGDLSALKEPSANCPKCDKPAEFDDVAETYFGYVASAAKPSPPPMVAALIEGKFAPPAASLRIEKEIDERITLLWVSGELDRGGHFKRLGDGLEGDVVVVLANVTSAKEAGLRGLSSFLRAPGPVLYLARIPLQIASLLATQPGSCGGAQVTSVLLPFNCESHGRFTAEVDGGSLRQSPPKINPPPCPTCKRPAVVATAPEELDEIRHLPLKSTPPHIMEALKPRTNGPLGAQALGSGSGSGSNRTNSFGRYELVKRIGMGGMAEVFLARQHGLMGFEKRVVLKRILPQYSSQAAFVSMFLEEARLAARISHPNVVQIFDLGQVGNQYFIAMEYVQGRDLAQLLRAAKEHGIFMPVEVACRLVMGICAGLQAAHTCLDNQGKRVVIVHRDISPHNVLVDTEGNVKVTDFGIAKVANSSGKTDPGVVKGKINYIAPELFVGQAPADGRVDIFAAGVILYQCLTNALPYFRSTDAATMRAILQDPVPPLSQYRSDLPAELDLIISKALARDPNERYPTAKAFEQELETVMGRLSIHRVSTSGWVESLAAATTPGDDDLGSLVAQPITFTPSDVGDSNVETAEHRVPEDLSKKG